jgi:hypothetical protein
MLAQIHFSRKKNKNEASELVRLMQFCSNKGPQVDAVYIGPDVEWAIPTDH